MDWKERNYYLINTSHESYRMRHEIYKIAAPSIKYSKPYNHFKKYWNDTHYWYDGDVRSEGIDFYPHEMISCRKEDSEALEFELRKAKRNDWYSRWIKLSKEMLGQ